MHELDRNRKEGLPGGIQKVVNIVEGHMHELDRNKREKAYRGAVHKVVDVMEGHGKGGEGQHHALLHIALLEAVAAGPLPETLSTLL